MAGPMHGAIIPKGGEGHQLENERRTVMQNGSIFAMLDSVFVESVGAGFL